MNRWKTLNNQIVSCDKCDRLREHCRRIAVEKRRAYRDCDYWGRPVPNFGDGQARLLIVGLAPGAHGANRTGRMFTGDRSGDWLYRALFKAGFANQPESTSPDDGLELIDCAITNACHCAPPDNKPTSIEIGNCRRWLEETISLTRATVFLALGQLAWKQLADVAIGNLWYEGRRPKFSHGSQVALSDNKWLLGSYHPSQQNTFTGRLTEPMFDDVFKAARRLIQQG